jgi:uracil-DNA glycosylase
MVVNLHQSWKGPLQVEFDSPYMDKLREFLVAEREAGKIIYPPASLWFHALDATPLDKVRVVILGQDPYHGEGQAHGLSFSVPHGVSLPPSLLNIYKELRSDLNISLPPHGNLQHWAKQGILLLNSVLTVQAGLAASHKNRGWERFTDAIIRLVNDLPHPVVFILWGTYAQKKAGFVNAKKHLVIKSVHPSPLSVHNGFFGSKHFSQTNDFLTQNGQVAIDWTPPSP